MNVKFFLIFSMALLTFSKEGRAAPWLDRSQTIFFPKDLQKEVALQESYSAFWWDFLMSTDASQKPGCVATKDTRCGFDMKTYQPMMQEWARDIRLRVPRPSNTEIKAHFQKALSMASFPGVDRDLINLLREDPLESWKDLRALGMEAQEDIPPNFVPLKFLVPPSATEVTSEYLRRILPGERLVGPHSASLENEREIVRDMSRVSNVGMVVLILFGILLISWRCSKLLLLVPPVVFVTALSALMTVWIFGSIHGLTLSFGTGIVGMAFDYGVHAGFNVHSKHVWRSNLFGLLTTLAGLAILSFSSIPLLRQMMVFSMIGLTVSFFLFYFLYQFYPKMFSALPVLHPPSVSPRLLWIVVALVIASVVGLLTERPSLDLSRFDFQSRETKEAQAKLFTGMKVRPPLTRVHSQDDLWREASAEAEWALGHGVRFESLRKYLPDPSLQKTNAETWTADNCDSFRSKLSPTERSFFEPFLKNTLCNSSLEIVSGSKPRLYLSHLFSQSHWLSLIFPRTIEEEKAIQVTFSDAHSIRERLTAFPKVLSDELKWMAPLSVVLAFALLMIHFQSAVWGLVALLPFFTGLGCFFLGRWIFGIDYSFLSVMALIMVFGFSIDYGIFATDLRVIEDEGTMRGVWSALALSGITSAAGFAPMLFCHHPVLKDLGNTFCLGTLGTFVGAFWGIPIVTRLIQK